MRNAQQHGTIDPKSEPSRHGTSRRSVSWLAQEKPSLVLLVHFLVLLVLLTWMIMTTGTEFVCEASNPGRLGDIGSVGIVGLQSSVPC